MYMKKCTRTNGTKSEITGTTYLFVNTSSSWNCFKPTVFPGEVEKLLAKYSSYIFHKFNTAKVNNLENHQTFVCLCLKVLTSPFLMLPFSINCSLLKKIFTAVEFIHFMPHSVWARGRMGLTHKLVVICKKCFQYN